MYTAAKKVPSSQVRRDCAETGEIRHLSYRGRSRKEGSSVEEAVS